MTSCNGGRPVEYRPVTDQVILIPKGATIVAPEGRTIRTDKAGELVDLKEIVAPYDGVLLSDGYFIKLVRDRIREDK